MPVFSPAEIAFLSLNEFRLLALRPLSKIPLDPAWEKSPLTFAEYSAKYPEPSNNVGLVTGNNIVDLDLDLPARYLPFASAFLPPPSASFGRHSKPASHWLYYCTDADPFQVLKRGTMQIEFRSVPTHQTMLPPSIHPSGEQVIWSPTTDLSKRMSSSPVPSDAILNGARRYLAACALADVWPAGARHVAALALTGMLLRIADSFPSVFPKGQEGVVDFVTTVCQMADDDEVFDRTTAAKDTLKKWTGTEAKLAGGKTLDKLLGSDTVPFVRRTLINDDTFERVEEWNKIYAVATIGNKVTVLREHMDGKGTMSFLSANDFRLWTGAQTVVVTTAKGTKTVPFADLWLRHPAARSYDGISFDPPPLAPTPRKFNLFQGWKYEPQQDERKLDLLKEHVLVNVANNDPAIAHWVWSFFADIVQNSARRPGVALILQGAQGTGKTFLTSIIGKVLSPYTMDVTSPKHLVGNFNSHLQNVLLISAHEAFFAGDRQSSNVLKGLVTDEKIAIERKGFDVTQQSNYLRLVMTTNEEWVVAAQQDERRYCVLRMGERNKQDHAFFDAIDTDMRSGGYAALMHFLQNYEYAVSALSKVPNTEALINQKSQSETPIVKWWRERLTAGEPSSDRLSWGQITGNGTDAWPEYAAKVVMWSDYERYAKSERYANITRQRFWQDFNQLLTGNKISHAGPETVYRTVPKEGRDPDNGIIGPPLPSSIQYYKMPQLAEAREYFKLLTGTTVEPGERIGVVVPFVLTKQ